MYESRATATILVFPLFRCFHEYVTEILALQNKTKSVLRSIACFKFEMLKIMAVFVLHPVLQLTVVVPLRQYPT